VSPLASLQPASEARCLGGRALTGAGVLRDRPLPARSAFTARVEPAASAGVGLVQATMRGQSDGREAGSVACAGIALGVAGFFFMCMGQAEQGATLALLRSPTAGPRLLTAAAQGTIGDFSAIWEATRLGHVDLHALNVISRGRWGLLGHGGFVCAGPAWPTAGGGGIDYSAGWDWTAGASAGRPMVEAAIAHAAERPDEVFAWGLTSGGKKSYINGLRHCCNTYVTCRPRSLLSRSG
jgi:hypothetical protein